MKDALQLLVDNGLSHETMVEVVTDLLEGDNLQDSDDWRWLAALLWSWDQGDKIPPDACDSERDDTVDINGTGYRVLSDEEADTACRESIEQSLWAFNAAFLSGETGIDDSVFEALADKCEDSNDAVRSIIVGSCGLDSFVESAISADGRGHFLNQYDGVEYEYRNGTMEFYLYKV